MAYKIPRRVFVTDVIHRVFVLGLFTFCVVGVGGIGFNIWANSDYARMNKNKLTFDKKQYEESRKQDEKEESK